MKLIAVVFTFLIITSSAFAAPAKTRPTSSSNSSAGQDGIVRTDSSMVYDQPSFDGAVISYLPAGQKVRISKKTFGSDVGLFFMIRLANGKVGYIADIDVQAIKSKKKLKKSKTKERDEEDESELQDSSAKEKVQEEKEKAEADEKERKQKEKEKREEEAEEAADAQREPIMYSSWVGPYVSSWGFKEKISGVKAEERLLAYGVKYTSPKLMPGTLLDLNLGFHFGAPSYYEQLSLGKPSGYIVFLDAEFLSPMIMSQDSFGYFGVGPLINYTSIRVKSVGGAPVDSNDLRLGAALTLGYSRRLGPIRGVLEGKYIIEKTQQIVFVISLQAKL